MSLTSGGGSVLTPHDYTTNVQRRLGNRVWTGFGQCRLCGSFLDHQLEQGESFSIAEATRDCMRSRRLVWKLADSRNPGGSQQRSPGRLIFSLPLLSQDAVRRWMCVLHLPTQQRLEVTQHEQLLIVNCLTTGAKSPTCATSAFFAAPWFGQQMGDHTKIAVTRTLPCAADIASSCNGQQMSAKSLQHPPQPFSTSRMVPRRKKRKSSESLGPCYSS